MTLRRQSLLVIRKDVLIFEIPESFDSQMLDDSITKYKAGCTNAQKGQNGVYMYGSFTIDKCLITYDTIM